MILIQSNKSSPLTTLASVLSAVITLAALSTDRADEADPAEPFPARALMLSSLEVLWIGDREARLRVADSISWLAPLQPSHPEHDAPTAESVAESLRQFLRAEKDDWILNRFADSLVLLDTPPADVLREALRSPSVNVRWKAIQWFADHDDADAALDLEKLWNGATTLGRRPL